MEDTFNLWTGSNRTLQVSASAIPNYDGCLLVIHDITRMMHLETVRRDFVANVSHELKTPITSIKGFVETLSDGALDDRPRAERYLEIIGKHANRLERIIEDLLSLARLEQQEKQTLEIQAVPVFSLCEEARQSCELLAQEKGIRISIEGPRELQWRANVSLMTQAILNLLDNGIKYSSPKTSIRLVIEATEGYVLLKVIDQGRGIPPKDLRRIFERFYRVNKERSREVGGTGLGLSIVKHVVTLHGGTVQVESQENEGSTFTIQLPQYL
jgi:two-component system phosphate regulon sensor histidine kinase PhoR